MGRPNRLRTGLCVVIAVAATILACSALAEGNYAVAGVQVWVLLTLAAIRWRGNG